MLEPRITQTAASAAQTAAFAPTGRDKNGQVLAPSPRYCGVPSLSLTHAPLTLQQGTQKVEKSVEPGAMPEGGKVQKTKEFERS